jgi:hypothetical protein
MKRGVAVILVFLMIVSGTQVLADPSLSFSPSSVYEMSHTGFALNISNAGGGYEIKDVRVTVPGFSAIAAVDYQGWTESKNGAIVQWSGGSIASNVLLSVFEFMSEAPPVASDTDAEASVVLTDASNAEHTYTFPLRILNDNTPPELSGMAPSDGGLARMGASEYTVKVNATDMETGIENVTFHYVRCNYTENITPNDHTLQLAQYQGIYQNTIDLSGYTDGNVVCFDFTAYNGGGDSSSYSGIFTVDGIPPSVTLVSPVDGATIGLNRNFSFFASDNLATEMKCSMNIDGSEYMKDIAAPHMDVVFIASSDVEEGEHEWSVNCADPAGWDAGSATWRYTLDRTAPTIVMTAPANNSIISQDDTLEFSVADNSQLHKVWLIRGGNATEVKGEFSISVADWPDGPSEFAVRAQDVVHNQAEQTYRVIVDRTAPQVELLAPAESGTSDVHVSFGYRVQDNYDNEMDCRVYIDDAGYEAHQAKSGEETVWPRLMANGEHRWKVQCADDAGNTGTSNERQVTVIDTSGPDIALNNPDEVIRGDQVQISLQVTDVSGVASVNAELTEPDGTPQTISLEKLGDTYTATVATTKSSKTGTYTLSVDAVDTLGFSSSAEDSISVVYRYVVALELAPASVVPGGQVVASGLVEYDNGTKVPETSVRLYLPGNPSVDADLDADGEYSATFNAPASDGTYDVVAAIESAGNGKAYNSTKTLTVGSPSPSGRGGGSGSGGKRPSAEVSCTPDWRCTAWTTCAGGEQTRVCADDNGCSAEGSREKRSCTVKEKTATEDEDSDASTETAAVSAVREPLSAAEEQQVNQADEDAGNAAGIGKASGFMSSLSVSFSNVLLALALMGLLLGVLYRYGWSKGDGRKRPASIDLLGGRARMDLESYLEERSKRSRF